MAENKNASRDQDHPGIGATLKRAAKIALILVGLLLGGLSVTALLADDETTLPFDYDGFD